MYVKQTSCPSNSWDLNSSHEVSLAFISSGISPAPGVLLSSGHYMEGFGDILDQISMASLCVRLALVSNLVGWGEGGAVTVGSSHHQGLQDVRLSLHCRKIDGRTLLIAR